MKKIFTLLFSLASFSSFSQIYWNFSNAEAGNIPDNITVDTLTVANTHGTVAIRTTSAVSDYQGASASFNAGLPAKVGGFDKDTSSYFQFVITPAAGYFASISAITFGSRSTGTGPKNYAIRTSVDNYASNVAADTLFPSKALSWRFITPVMSMVNGTAKGQAITVRIYGFLGTGSAGLNVANWRIDDLSVTATAATTLPLVLSSFKGSLVDGAAKLNWTSENEINVTGFSIEKSADAKTFSEIGFVNAANVAGRNGYTFTDNKLKAVNNFYRLVMVDKDGRRSFSSVIPVIFTGNMKVAVYPNPTSQNISVTHAKAGRGATIVIFSTTGRQMQVIPVEAGATQTGIGINNLSKGTYVVSFNDKGSRTVSTFIKQ